MGYTLPDSLFELKQLIISGGEGFKLAVYCRWPL